MLDVILVDGQARGIVTRNLVTGEDRAVTRRCGGARDRRLLQRLLPVHQRHGLQRHRGVAGAQAGRRIREPVLHADPPDLHSGGGRLPVEAHADERVAAQRRPDLGVRSRSGRRPRPPGTSPRTSATTTSSACIRRSETWCRGTSRPGAPRTCATRGRASARPSSACIWTSRTPSSASAADVIEARYGNLFEMYERITGENPYKVPMRIYPGAPLHDGRPVGGLQSHDHAPRAVRDRRGELLRPRGEPARRERADAGSGGRLLRPSVHDRRLPRAAKRRIQSPRTTPDVQAHGRGSTRRGSIRLLALDGNRTVDAFHRELGRIIWDDCGMGRNATGLKEAMEKIPELREEFWENAKRRRRAGTRSTRSSSARAGSPTSWSWPS